jgi:class 3 adenylate cyclase
VRSAVPVRRHATHDAEKRVLTVLFCDIVGSTEVAQRIDPEDMRDLIQRYQSTCAAIAGRYSGHVAQLLGDGLLVYFGYPQALERAPELAIRAGLAMVKAVGELRREFESAYGELIQVHVGIHRGPVVVSDVGGPGHNERLAVGGAVHIASRLESVATPGEVVVSEETLQLVPGVFMTRSLGEQSLKGVSRKIRAFNVLRPIGGDRGLDLGQADLELVGRKNELALMLERWELARTERGSVVLLGGDAGIGKSRLTRELRRRLSRQSYTWLEGRCAVSERDRPLHPVVEIHRRAIGYRENDSPDEQLARLEAAVANSAFDLTEAVPILAGLHGVPLGDRYEPPALGPDALREKTLQICCDWLLRLAESQPTVLLMEDVHWADPTTLALLSRVVERAPSTNLLAIYSFRPEFEPPWPVSDAITPITLSRLSRAESEQLARVSSETRELSEDAVEHVVERVVEHALGVPLYIEELSKVVPDGGASAEVAAIPIPSTLEDSLRARLDSLGSAIELAQLTAAIGREFRFDLLRVLWPGSDEALEAALDALESEQLIYRRGQPPEASYIFKHALIQDVAYDSLLRKDRESIHGRIAETLEREFPSSIEEQPDLLARHYAAAGRPASAIRHYQAAARRAQRASAHAEAINLLQDALRQLEGVSDQAEAVSLELGVRMLLNVSLIPTRGYAAPEVEECSLRAGALAEKLGSSEQSFIALWGLWLFHLVRAHRDETHDLVGRLFEIADQTSDPTIRVQAHSAATLSAFYAGDHEAVLENYRAGLQHWDPDRGSDSALVYGDDAVTYLYIYHGLSQWMLGRPDLALSEIETGLRRAEAVRHPFTLAGSLAFVCQLRFLRREPDQVAEFAKRTLEYSSAQNFPLFLANALLYQSFPLLESGSSAEALTAAKQALAFYSLTGARLNSAFYCTHLVPMYLATGELEQGLQAVDDALAHAAAHLDRYAEPELYRLRGELCLARDDAVTAERDFLAAIESARAGSALSYELRAAMSLARLEQARGDTAAALARLETVYERFEEGFDTADLCDARALIDELRAPR